MKNIKNYEGFSFFKKKKEVKAESPNIKDDVDNFSYAVKSFLESFGYEVDVYTMNISGIKTLVKQGDRNQINVFYNPYDANNDRAKYKRGPGEIDVVRLNSELFEFYCSNSDVPDSSMRDYIHSLCEKYTQKYLGSKSKRVTDKSNAGIAGTYNYSTKAIPEIINELTLEDFEIWQSASKYNL